MADMNSDTPWFCWRLGLIPFFSTSQNVNPKHPIFWENRKLMTRKKNHSPEQIVKKLAQADKLIAEGASIAEVCRQLEVHQQTYYRWRNNFAGMSSNEAKRLKELEKQNAALKRLLAEAELEKAVLKELAEGNF